MARLIPLDGNDWQIRSFYGEDWTWIDAHKPELKDSLSWLPACVPGSIQADLAKAGAIPDPYFERNSLASEWVPQRTWVYRKSFFAGEELAGQRVSLNYQGVDYEASFYLNGELLGRRRSMFTPGIFDVSHLLNYGAQNLLAVVLEPAPPEPSQFGSTTLARAHKPRMNYWWDFCPRIIHLGIWESVYLSVTGPARLEDVFVRPQWRPGQAQAEIGISVPVSCSAQIPVKVETCIYFGEEVVAAETRSMDRAESSQGIEHQLVIPEPRLWWPNGSGEQLLYTARIRLILPDGTVSDEKETRFGIRHVELALNEGAEEGNRPWTFVVNGEKSYIKGWNWVPMDVLYGKSQPEKLDHLLRLAQQAHVNLLRVWGGGLIERERFYDLCDQYGILVWQEFILSCSGFQQQPSDDPEYVAYLAQEAEGIIPNRRNHPSLVMWCGGNELCTDMETPVDDSSPAIAALHAAVKRLDPDRLWLPTSPSHKPRFQVEVHGPWNYLGLSSHYEHYNRSDSQFYSEFGTEGITNLKTLNAVIDPEHQWPVSLTNPYWNHLAVWWVRPEWKTLYGEVQDIQTLQRATQLTQAEGLKYALEAGRRRQFQNSGTLPWQFDEPFPMAACTSAVDYYGQPKPVYYAASKAYEPLHVSARFDRIAWEKPDCFEAEIWASSSLSRTIPTACCRVRLIGANGRTYAEQSQDVTLAANGSTCISWFSRDISRMQESVFFLDLQLVDKSGQILSENRYPFTRSSTLAPILAQPNTMIDLQVEKSQTEWKLEMVNRGPTTAMFVWLEDARPVGSQGFIYFQENYFCLLPGEKRSFIAWWDQIAPEERRLDIRAWNAKIR